MLLRIKLENYRCYDKHEIDFKNLSIIVGKNNAGKSTIIEALRLLQIIISRYQFINYSRVPRWLDVPKTYTGVSPSLLGYEFVSQNLFHRYSEPPAIITASFSGGSEVKIYIGKEENIHAVLFDVKGNVINTKAKALAVDFPTINILPQISPLIREERVLSLDYVKRNISSNLASIHFRNQINALYAHFPRFQELSQKSWKGLRIRELIGNTFMPGKPLSLMVQDNDFVAEVSWMGHGLQMWLQTMWFLARTSPAAWNLSFKKKNNIRSVGRDFGFANPDLRASGI